MSKVKEAGRIRGFTRLRIINPDGSVHGDSGYVGPNQITNLGFNQFLAQLLGGMAGSKVVSHVALGTGSEPGAAATSLEGEVEKRQSITAATSSSSKRLRATATFNSALSFVTTTMSLSNIGLFASSAKTTETLFAGNTFASSTCASNQAVNMTYDIDFS